MRGQPTMSLRSVTKPLKREDRLRIGDVLDEALYGQPAGARQPTLLLAAGHRIESVVQLRRLQEAGFPVDMPRAEAPPAPEPAESDTSSTSRTGSPPSVRAAIQ